MKQIKYEELLVTDNFNIEVIKALGHFKLFECIKMFFNNMDTHFERACVANVKEKYQSEIYDTITNYNDRNHIPLSSANNREAINQLIMEEQAESNNINVDTFSPQRNESEDLIKKVANFTINEVGNNLIDKLQT